MFIWENFFFPNNPWSAHDVTKTKKYHDLANRIAEKGFAVRFFAFEVGCRGLVGKSLRKFLTALLNFRRRSLKKLSPIAQSLHWNALLQHLTQVLQGHPSIGSSGVTYAIDGFLVPSIGVLTLLIMFYSIWQLLMTESTMSHMLEGFYLTIFQFRTGPLFHFSLSFEVRSVRSFHYDNKKVYENTNYPCH